MYKAINKDGATSRTRYFERATVFVKYASLRRMIEMYLVSTIYLYGGRHLHEGDRLRHVPQDEREHAERAVDSLDPYYRQGKSEPSPSSL